MRRYAVWGLMLVLLTSAATADDKAKRSPKEALQPFNELIGGWKGVGEPEGTAQEKQKGFWRETVNWGWKFKGDDAWLVLTIANGKHYKSGELHYVPEKDLYRLTMTTKEGKDQAFEEALAKDKRSLTVERLDEAKKENHRITIQLIGEIRSAYRSERKPESRKNFAKEYQVTSTKEGESFGKQEKKPECVVSGGLGTMTVSHKGETFYVCCTGCRDAFNDDPEKYIKEFKAKKAKGE